MYFLAYKKKNDDDHYHRAALTSKKSTTRGLNPKEIKYFFYFEPRPLQICEIQIRNFVRFLYFDSSL
jgi:hypothetical protein